MRFIKRFIFVLVLFLIAFFIYRIINPAGAKSLLYDLKSFSNDKIGTNFSLTSNVVALTGTVFELTGTVVEMTGDILEDTGSFQDSGDELFLEDVPFSEEDAAKEEPATEPEPEVDTPSTTTTTTPPKTTVTPPKKVTTPSSVDGLSRQELRDLKSLLENFQ